MLTGSPNYLMIRRAIFGKVHGHGVKEIWLISQFPTKNTGVASGAKIVFTRPGLAKLLGCGHGVINNEVIIYIACSPQSDCISIFRDPSVTFWPFRTGIYVHDVPGGGTPHMKGVGMFVVPLRGVNFRFWSHLGDCSGQNAIIFSREGLV